MPKIINAYSTDSPIAGALTDLSKSFFSTNVPQQEFLRQKALGLRRENENIPLLADAVPGNDPALTARLGILSGVDPKVAGGYRQYYGVQKYGPGSSEATRDTMSVPGANYGHTVAGTREDLGNRRTIAQMTADRQLAGIKYTADNTPVNAVINGQPTFVSRSRAISDALRPVISATEAEGTIRLNQEPNMTSEQRATAGGYAVKPPSNLWVGATATGAMEPTMDGRTGVQTGAPIVGPVKKLEGESTDGLTGNDTIDRQRLESRVATEQLVAGAERLKTELSKPNAGGAVGYLGTLARGVNDLRAQMEATTRVLGGEKLADALAKPEIKGAVETVTAKLTQQLGIDSSIIRSQVQDLAYMIAKQQDPGGRVSTDDVRRAAETLGANLMDPAAMSAVLTNIQTRAQENHGIRERELERLYPTATRPGAAAPAQGAAPAAPAPVENWERGPDGRMRRTQ
jgi:hypothetical protein